MKPATAQSQQSIEAKERIGAALFAAGRPLRLKELSALVQLSAAETSGLLSTLQAELSALRLGFALEEVAGGFRLVVPAEVAQHLAPLLSAPALPPLSAAALEVLAIIAYKQPITRAEIEAMRGGSASTVVTLQERELVKVAGRADAVGQPLLYATTEKFLLEFGLNTLAELPELEPAGAEFGQLLRG